jgi:hypothetical protein
MNIASLENCQKLFELSGWDDTDAHWKWHPGYPDKPEVFISGEEWPGDAWTTCVAYDLGYLLRHAKGMMVSTDPIGERGNAMFLHFADNNRIYEEHADTPEDAACLLACKLFETGILKKGETA